MKPTAVRTTGMLAVSILIAVFAVAPVAFAAGNVTFCHQEGNGRYQSNTTTDPASILREGHGGHPGDIIPAFDYLAFGSTPAGHYDGLNLDSGGDGQAWLDRNCQPPPQLTLVKTVDNSAGGAALPSAWTLSAVGPTTISGQTGTSGAALAGPYALSESPGPTGYTGSPWSCSLVPGATLSGASGHQSVTFSAAAVTDVTCTIKNTFVPTQPQPHMVPLRLVKVVVGGNTSAGAWTLDAVGTTSGTTPFAGASTPATDSVAEGTYNLSESPDLAGYSSPGWACSNAQGFVQSVTIGSIDEAVTCTITNRFVPPETQLVDLRLVKVVDGGGPAVATDWTLSAAGPTSFDGKSGTDSATKAVPAGTYALTESGPSGYTGSDWVCPGADVSGDRGSQTVTIGSDVEAVTCTITNTFVQTQPPVVPVDTTVQPKITLKATVVNDAGGTAQVSDFTLTGSSIQVASAAAVQNSAAMVASAATTSFSGVTGDAAITNAVVPVGTYSLSESALPLGYSASAWACTGGQLNGSAITVTFGNAVECVITNTFSSTVVGLPGVPTAHPASPPAAVLGVNTAAPGAKAPTAKAPTAKAPSAAIPAATTLAFTGAEPVPLSLLALLALVLGVALTVVGRRQGSQGARG
jgi:hypothetical protein